MKTHPKLILIHLLAALLLTLASCEKEEPVKLATLSTLSVTNITTNTAQSGGNITSDGGGDITSRGVVWSTNPNPTAEQNTGLTMDGGGPGLFQSNITNLQPNTTYYVRAYATNEAGMVYGNAQQFKTMGTAPITTNPVSNITQNSATSGGNITSDGGASITARGVVWGTTQNPTVETNLGSTNNGTGTGSFTSNLTGLSANITYYVRAYATNSSGTGYGSQVQFTTTAALQMPTITTTSISNISQNSAIGGGNVTNDSGANVTSRGVVWSTSQNPTLENNLGSTNNGAGTGSFTSNLAGLSAGSTYYVRAYATNSAGTAYGNQVQFTTHTALQVPTINTASISNVSQNSATSGGNITNDGGANITTRGVVWSTSQNPTVESNLGSTNNGSGTGSFTSNLTGLSASTTYYVRAYATNSEGTAYGSQVQFATTAAIQLPTVTTTSISNITQNSATGGGNVTSDGGANITTRGVVWSTSQNPTLENNTGSTNNGSGTGSFTSNLTSLAASTTYYVKAYSINIAGTGYGEQVQFTTEVSGGGNIQPGAGVTDIDGNFYPSVIIGNQEWMAENLRVTRDANGNDITRYCYYYYPTDATYCDLSGGLYTWHTVMNGATSSNTNPSNVQGICPTGWHVPSDAEWTELVDYVVAQGYPNSNVVTGAGNALKSCRQVSSPLGGDCATSEHPRWDSHPPHYGTDEFGFSALPGGERSVYFINYPFVEFGNYGYWWSSTETSTDDLDWAWYRKLSFNNGFVTRSDFDKGNGFSVRCVRDN
jgi:uncharacterized protein (TIGR02145 family)